MPRTRNKTKKLKQPKNSNQYQYSSNKINNSLNSNSKENKSKSNKKSTFIGMQFSGTTNSSFTKKVNNNKLVFVIIIYGFTPSLVL